MKTKVKFKGFNFLLIIIISLSSCEVKEENDPVIPSVGGQIIADHTVIDKYDNIPQEYINKVKRMWLVYAGESHSSAIRKGLLLLEGINSAYQVNVIESGTPESYTEKHLRVSRATWGDLSNTSGWIYSYGEEDWYTNETAISRTKEGIAYCNNNSLTITAMGFGWCTDMYYGSTKSSIIDPVYGCYWYGVSVGGPNGNRCWGLDDEDNTITGNTVNMDTYLQVTQEYIDYCKKNSIPTIVFFTTGPVDATFDEYTPERGYQAYLKHEYIRNYVKSDTMLVLFDYADILCYDNDGSYTTVIWNGHEFPWITPTNLGDKSIGHIGREGAIRLAKAMWWMLARIAGWDGN